MSEKLYDFPVDHDVSNLLVYWLPQTMLLSVLGRLVNAPGHGLRRHNKQVL
jgi:hypothetical protein